MCRPQPGQLAGLRQALARQRYSLKLETIVDHDAGHERHGHVLRLRAADRAPLRARGLRDGGPHALRAGASTRPCAPLGESVDDFEALRAAREGDQRAGRGARDLPPVKDTVFRQAGRMRDYSQRARAVHARWATINKSTRDIGQFLIDSSVTGHVQGELSTSCRRRASFACDDADGVQFGPRLRLQLLRAGAATRDKQPYETLTGRQQFYFDHDWFLQEGEGLPVHRAPAGGEGLFAAADHGPCAPRRSQHVAGRFAAA